MVNVSRGAAENCQEFKLAKTTIAQRCSTKPPLHSILQNQSKTEVLLVLPPTARRGAPGKGTTILG